MEMLAQATKARVAGSNIFSGSALRLTRSVVAATPREAWQAVFGDVANFAIACAGSACEVRFVSLAKPGAPVLASGAPVRGPDAEQADFSSPTQSAIAPTYARPEPVPISHAARAAKAAADGDETPSSEN